MLCLGVREHQMEDMSKGGQRTAHSSANGMNCFTWTGVLFHLNDEAR